MSLQSKTPTDSKKEWRAGPCGAGVAQEARGSSGEGAQPEGAEGAPAPGVGPACKGRGPGRWAGERLSLPLLRAADARESP